VLSIREAPFGDKKPLRVWACSRKDKTILIARNKKKHQCQMARNSHFKKTNIKRTNKLFHEELPKMGTLNLRTGHPRDSRFLVYFTNNK
jgi:hypothetical protein